MVYPVKLEKIQAYLNGGGTVANLEKLLNWEESIHSGYAKGRGVAKLYHTDLTGDSVPDVLISSQGSFRYYTPHTRLLFFFCRDGQYEGGPILSVDGGIFYDSSLGVWHIGDMNSNGVPEVVFSEESYGRSVHIMEWNGNQMVPLVKNIANAIAVARGDARIVDVDGNGTLELVVRHNFSCLEKAVRPDRVDVYAWDGHYFSLAYSEELTQSTYHIPPTTVLEHSGWSTYNIYDGVVGNYVKAIAVGPDDTLWFGSFEGGVSHFDGQTWTIYTTNEGLLSNYVLSIAIAPDGTVWLADGGGVSRFDVQAWTTYTEKDGLTNWKEATAIAVAVAPDGTVWFGTWHSGVFYFDGEAWHSALDDNIVPSITITPDGTVWFGTLWNGVFRFDGETWINYTAEDGLASDSVLSIAVIPDNALWFGTTGGVSRFDGQTWTTYTTDDGLPDNRVLSIAVGHDGALWFGTDSGVTRFDGKSWVTYTMADGLADNQVWSIAVASDGALWFGTEYGGISRYLPPN